MGFDESRDDFWSGRGGPSHSKGNLLQTAIEHGGFFTGYWEGHECPYYGVHAHAEELVADGHIIKCETQPLAGMTLWALSDAYKIEIIEARKKRDAQRAKEKAELDQRIAYLNEQRRLTEEVSQQYMRAIGPCLSGTLPFAI
jgi:hypothetical protein